MYEALVAPGTTDMRIVIPSKKTAAVDSHAKGAWCQHNDAIERIGDVGRRQWRKELGAHRQACAATTALGMPESAKIVA